MSTIERVARAITSELQAIPYDDLPEAASYIERKTHVDRPILDRQEAREVAIAAIRAIREPDGDLLAVGDKAIFNADGDWRSNACWRAMIDSILSEEGEKP